MSRLSGRGIGSRSVGAVAVVASTLVITLVVGGTGHLDGASATTKRATGNLEVCSVAAANSPSLVGQPFHFIEHSSNSYIGPFTLDAGTRPGTSCGGVTKYQVGTTVHVGERTTLGTVINQVTVQSGQTVTTKKYGQCSGVVPPIAATIGTSGTTIVTYTNAIAIPYLCPAIEVCVMAADSGVQGSFNFTLTSLISGSLWSKRVSINLAQDSACSGDVVAPPGQVTVTEESNPTYYVSAIEAIPTGDLVSENLTTQSATFSVGFGHATTAIFTDSTAIAQLAPVAGRVVPGDPFTDQLHTNGVSPVTFTVTSARGGALRRIGHRFRSVGRRR